MSDGIDPNLADPAPAPRTPFEHHIHERVGSLEDSRKTWRWIIGLGLPVIASVGLALFLWAESAVQTSSERAGETKATLEAVKKTIDTLGVDIRELRGILVTR